MSYLLPGEQRPFDLRASARSVVIDTHLREIHLQWPLKMIKETMEFSTRTILTSEGKITLELATPKNELVFFSLKLRV